MKKLKVLQVIPNLAKGGAQRLVIDICNQFLTHENIDCKLVVLNKSENHFLHLSNFLDIVYCDVKFQLSFFQKHKINIQEYEDIVNDFKPDIIHSHLYFSELIVNEQPRKNIKYITHFHDNIEQFLNFSLSILFSKKRVTNFFEKKRLFNNYKKTSKLFLTISKHSDSYARKVLPKRFLNNIEMLHNAINISAFKNPEQGPNPTNIIKLINVGNLLTKKNQVFLVDVVKYIYDQGYKVELELVGEGACRNEIVSKINNLGLTNNIFLKGAINNVQKALWSSSIYIHSAKYEPFGLVFLEAMAAKIPIISYNGEGNKDLIINGETGFLINTFSPKIFGDTAIKLSKNMDLYNSIVDTAFNFSKRFDISDYCNNLIKRY